MLTVERLKELLSYDPISGDFTWKVARGRQAAASPAGCVKKGGYKHVRIDSMSYQAHRLAYLYMTGGWPADEIDHINGDPGDNRWANLRDANRSQQVRNSAHRRSNTTGVKCMYYLPDTDRFLVRVEDGVHKPYVCVLKDRTTAAVVATLVRMIRHGDRVRKGKSADDNHG